MVQTIKDCKLGKRAFFIAILLVGVLFLASCGNSSQEATSSSDSTDWHDLQYSCGGIRVNYEAGYTINDLLSLGYTTSTLDTFRFMKKLAPGEKERYILQTNDGRDAIYVRVQNNTSRKLSCKKCEAVDIVSMEYSNSNNTAVMELNNGITIGTSSSEVIELMGEPDNVSGKDGKETWTYYVDDTQTQFVEIKIKEDVVYLLHLQYFVN